MIEGYRIRDTGYRIQDTGYSILLNLLEVDGAMSHDSFMTICFLKGEGPNVPLYPPRALLGYKVLRQLLPSFSTAHYFITLCVNQQISTNNSNV